jgi:hypothetical protein
MMDIVSRDGRLAHNQRQGGKGLLTPRPFAVAGT